MADNVVICGNENVRGTCVTFLRMGLCGRLQDKSLHIPLIP